MEQIFYNIFEQLPRVGPGHYESTKKAFDIIRQVKTLPENPKILDIGCGTGRHTVDLAKLSNGHITALDNHQEFLDRLTEHAAEQGCADRIQTVLGDMAAIDVEPHVFDIIWAEGSIFILGLEKGLNLWKKHLKPDGILALTDLFWLKPGAPGELKTFFEHISPGMMSSEDALKVIETCGYQPVSHFQLPACAWWDDFYLPLEEVLKQSRSTYSDNPDAMGLIQHLQMEIDMFRKYPEYYGYVFFIMQPSNPIS